MTTLRHLFPPQSINLIDIHPLKYEVFLQEVLAHEAAAHLIQVDLQVSYEEAHVIFRKSCTFGNHMHDSDTPENETHLAAAARQVARSKQHTPSVYRSWIQSGSELDVDTWLGKQKSLSVTMTEEELQIKQEEMDMDPFADDGDDSIEFVGLGMAEDPIDLTLDSD